MEKPNEKEQETIVVRVGLFSGLPDPEMKLDEEKARRFAELVVAAVGKEPANPPPPPKLGEFHGFLAIVSERRAKDFGLTGNVTVFRGVITEIGLRKPRYWRDVEGAEAFLMRLAFHDYGELLRKVGIEEAQ